MMKAFRRHARRERAASLVEVPVPVPGKNQVLLKVSHCGICGSDLHAWLNHPGYESVLPEVTFGHELSGSVVSTGPDAGDWKEGDREPSEPRRASSAESTVCRLVTAKIAKLPMLVIPLPFR